MIFPCICWSICPACCLLLNHWVEFNQTCYITSLSLMVRVCKSNIIFLCLNLSMCLFICPSGYNNINILCIHLSVRLSICPSRFLLLITLSVIQPNLLHCVTTEQNSTELVILLPLMVRVCISLSMGRASISLSVRLSVLNQEVEFNQTCNMASPHGKGVREQVCPSVMLLATSMGIYSGASWIAHSSFSYFSLKIYVIGTHSIDSAPTTCFCGEIKVLL